MFSGWNKSDFYCNCFIRNITLSHEKRLLSHLMAVLSMTGKEGRPIKNISEATPVYFGVGLIQLDLDEKNKILSCSVWSQLVRRDTYMYERLHCMVAYVSCGFQQNWMDDYLHWDPDDFGGVREVHLDQKYLWIPDVMLYNT